MGKKRGCGVSNSKTIHRLWSDNSSLLLAQNQGLEEQCWPAIHLEIEVLDFEVPLKKYIAEIILGEEWWLDIREEENLLGMCW